MRSLRLGFFLSLTLAAILASSAQAAGSLRGNQKEQLKSLAAETRRRTDDARACLARARMELVEVYMDYSLDDRRARLALEKISKAQLDLLNTNLENQLRLRRILEADQFEQFNNMFSRRMGSRSMPPIGGASAVGPEWFAESRVLDSLHLSREERSRLSAAAEPGREAVESIRKLRDNTSRIFSLYRDYALDESAARRLIRDIHRSQEELANRHLAIQRAVRTVLSESQFDEYQQALRDRMKARSGRKPPRRP